MAAHSTTPCSHLKHRILGKAEDLIYVTDQDQRCAVALPMPDNLGENVEVYVEATDKVDVYLVHDDSGLMLRFRESGYRWGESPNDDRLAGILARYGAEQDNSYRTYLRVSASELPDAVWRLGAVLSEAMKLTVLGRTGFRYNFRRVVREYFIESKITHTASLAMQGAKRPIIFDFGLGQGNRLLLNALSAASTSQADSVIARSFQDITLFNKARETIPKFRVHKVTIAYDDESEIAESKRFPELEGILDIAAIPASEIDVKLTASIREAGTA